VADLIEHDEWRFAMALSLRADFVPRLRGLARKTKGGPQAHWPWCRSIRERDVLGLPGLGRDCGDCAGLGDEIQCSCLGGLIERKAPGRAARLNDTRRAALAKVIDEGPVLYARASSIFANGSLRSST
jgi:hypothetical protein